MIFLGREFAADRQIAFVFVYYFLCFFLQPLQPEVVVVSLELGVGNFLCFFGGREENRLIPGFQAAKQSSPFPFFLLLFVFFSLNNCVKKRRQRKEKGFKRKKRTLSLVVLGFLPKVKLMGKKELITKQSPEGANNVSPAPPPLPGAATKMNNGSAIRGKNCVSTATRDLWDSLFDEGYRADVTIKTDNGGILYAHANVLGMASPVLRGMLKQAKGFGQKKSISINGVPHDAVRVFIRFLYSSCYEKEEMEEFVLPLLVLSHTYVVPQLKRLCEQQLEHALLTLENVVDVFQLSLLCDAPRLVLIVHRMILRNFKAVSSTEGWKAMQKSHPVLEKELLESMIDEENMQKKKIREMNERKIYVQLYEAMEALVHICRDGCRTIGPHDKDFKEDQTPCNYGACKGLELLIRHFAGCKLRVPGGCIHCKRMWQLLELHSRLCTDSNSCRVPLCGNFKEKIRKQSKKDEIKWTILVKKILRARRRCTIPCAYKFHFSRTKKV